MELLFYQAECGDAARIRFMGADQKYHNIIIDSGYERTFRHVLADEIRKIESLNEVIDLWVVSHIHDDHIGGVTKYIKSIRDGEMRDIVGSWLYNLPRPLSLKSDSSQNSLVISESKSISQGDLLSNYLNGKNKIAGEDVTNGLPELNFHGMRIIFLSPDSTCLEQLRSKYSTNAIELERNEADMISYATAATVHDYHIPVGNFDLKNWVEDVSIENRSSIALITEFDDMRVMWLADAHPSVVVDKLRELGYSKTNQIKCDWVKVTHHGSKGNNSGELYEMISCTNFLISANGENIHCLPTKECITRILKNSGRPKGAHYKFFFSYENKLLRSIFEIDGAKVFNDLNFSIHFPPKDCKAIRIEDNKFAQRLE